LHAGRLKQEDGGKLEVGEEAVVTFTRGSDVVSLVADEYGGFYEEYERGMRVWLRIPTCRSGLRCDAYEFAC
jgi:hypothetical protein